MKFMKNRRVRTFDGAGIVILVIGLLMISVLALLIRS